MVDNDMDMLVDCADPDCASIAPCLTRAPAMAGPAMIGLLVMLGASGLMLVTRRRKSSH